jgi:hypothetical protein
MVGFQFDNFVRLQGLGNAAYNGKLAVIKSTSADENAGRFLVVLQENEVLTSLSREIFVKPENMLRACDCCHLAGAATMQYCGRCKNAAYCNAECQRSDWMGHKVDCSRMCNQRQHVKSPLHVAATPGNLAEVQNLVREGADVNKVLKESGITALFIAAQKGHLAVVQYLVQQGADKEKARSDGCTPLYTAAMFGHLAVVQYLVQQGADKNKANNNCATPLFVAAQCGQLAVVQYLIQQGADKDKANNDGATPLYMEAAKGHLAVVQYLVQQGADINQADNDGCTPLLAATTMDHTAVANYLREHGAV